MAEAGAKRERCETDGEAGREDAGPSRSSLRRCRRIKEEYEKLAQLGEGTYGSVYRARHRRSGFVYAVKRVRLEREREGFPQTSVREIGLLMRLKHPSIVNVREVCVGDSSSSIFVVLEYVEHDLKDLLSEKKSPFTSAEVKCLMRQLLSGVNYLHSNFVIHRDLKTSNLLYSNRGEMKLCDFGMARQFGDPLRRYTQTVVTLWYRPPELLLGQEYYSTAVDMWSMGCVMAEILSREPLFRGKAELDQLDTIFDVLGSPDQERWPGYESLPLAKRMNFKSRPGGKLRQLYPAMQAISGKPTLTESGFDLLSSMLSLDPEQRPSAESAQAHGWFDEFPPAKDQSLMPSFPAKTSVKEQRTRSPDPLEEQRKREQERSKVSSETAAPALFAFAD
jgi:cell division cycle 2-like protein